MPFLKCVKKCFCYVKSCKKQPMKLSKRQSAVKTVLWPLRKQPGERSIPADKTVSRTAQDRGTTTIQVIRSRWPIIGYLNVEGVDATCSGAARLAPIVAFVPPTYQCKYKLLQVMRNIFIITSPNMVANWLFIMSPGLSTSAHELVSAESIRTYVPNPIRDL